jgi:hypothetical protein
MKLVFLYRPNSEHSRDVEQYAKEFKQLYPNQTVELMDVDSVAGVDKARLYDIVEYPAVLVARDDDGSLSNYWTGEPLPLMNELVGHLNT